MVSSLRLWPVARAGVRSVERVAQRPPCHRRPLPRPARSPVPLRPTVSAQPQARAHQTYRSSIVNSLIPPNQAVIRSISRGSQTAQAGQKIHEFARTVAFSRARIDLINGASYVFGAFRVSDRGLCVRRGTSWQTSNSKPCVEALLSSHTRVTHKDASCMAWCLKPLESYMSACFCPQ